VRDDQSRFVDDVIAKQDEIEIERARRVDVRPLPVAGALDGEQRVEQRPRRGRGHADDRRIQEARLRAGNADGIGFVIAGYLEIVEQQPEPGNCEVEVRAPIAEIAAERDCSDRAYSIHRVARTSP